MPSARFFVAATVLVACSSARSAREPAPGELASAAVRATALADGSIRVGRATSVAALLRPALPTPTHTTTSATTIERTRGEVVEIIDTRKTGIEVSWRFAAAPRDRFVRIGLEGAEVLSQSADGLRLRGDGATVRISTATWVDADGRRTPIPLLVEGSSVVLEIPADVVATSTYPAVLDPTISAEIEVDAPTVESGAGTHTQSTVGFDGTSFVAAWTELYAYNKAGIGLPRVRFNKVPVTGDVTATGTMLLPGYLDAFATSPTGSLVVTHEADDLFARRVDANGKLLDDVSIPLGRSSNSSVQVAFDGTRFVVARANDAGDKIVFTHVPPTGAATTLAATITGRLYLGTSFACLASGTCLIAYYGDGGGTPSAQGRLVGAAGPTGTPISFPDTPDNGPPNVAVAAASSDFVVGFAGPQTLETARVSAAGVLGARSPVTVTMLNTVSLAVGPALTLASWFENFDVRAARIPSSGATTPTWTAKLGTDPAGGYGNTFVSAAVSGTTVLATVNTVDPRSKARAMRFDGTTAPAASVPALSMARGARAQYHAALASSGTNHLLAWVEEVNARNELRARTVDLEGKPVSAPVVLKTFDPELYPLSLGATFDGTRYHVIYRTMRDYTEQPLDSVRVATDGTVLDATPTKVDTGGYLASTATIAGGGNRALAAWIDANALTLRRFDAAGAPTGDGPQIVAAATALSPVSRPGDHVGVSFDGKRFLVTWPTASGATTDLVGVFVDDTTIGTPFPIASLPGAQAEVGSAWNGASHLVAWVDALPNAPSTIRAVRVDDTGKVLDTTPAKVLTGVCAVCAPSVRWDGSSFVVAAYSDGVGYAPRELRVARVRADGVTADEPVTVVTKEARLWFLEGGVAMSSDGKGTTLFATSPLFDAAPIHAPRARLYVHSAKRPAGSVCSAAAECDDAQCVDGVCCKTVCAGACEACNVPGALGACTPVAGKPRGARTCGGSPDVCGEGSCDGSDGSKCASFARAVGAACGAPSCQGTSFLAAATCSDAHACVKPQTTECAPYRCAESGCLKTCAANEDCVGGASCVANSCVPSPTGARCSDDKLSSVSKEGVTAACTPYRCDTNGACASSCASSSECVPGFNCDGSRCVEAGAVAEDAGGCSTSRGRGTAFAGAILFMALLAALRRARARALPPLLLVGLLGCRASTVSPEESPSAVPLGTTQQAVTVGPESMITESTVVDDVGAPGVIGCHATGCLLVQARAPWLVGIRIGADGQPIDGKGIIIANSLDALATDAAVGSDGTDFLVALKRHFTAPSVVRVSADGTVAGPPEVLVPASVFASNLKVGWDGKTWIVFWSEGKTGSAVVTAARVQKDGTRLDPSGVPVLATTASGVSAASIAPWCDASGCTVGVGLPGNGGSGKIVRFVDGKVVGNAIDVAMPLREVAKLGTDLIFTGLMEGATPGLRAMTTSLDGTPKIAPKVVTTDYHQSHAMAVLGGAPVAFVSFTSDVPQGRALRLDGNLAVAESATLPASFQSFAGGVGFAGKLVFSSPDAIYRLSTAPFALSRIVTEKREIAQVRPAVASNGTTRVVAFARVGAGNEGVYLAKLTNGVLDTPVRVATETQSVRSVGATWDGANFVVGWTTDGRAAVARVSEALAVVDATPVVLFVTIPDPMQPDRAQAIGFGVADAGAIAIVTRNTGNTLIARLSKATGQVLGSTTTTALNLFDSVSAASQSGTTLLVLQDHAVRLAGDGTVLDTQPVKFVETTSSYQMTTAARSDGTQWWLASDAEAQGLGTDIMLVPYKLDLSARAAEPWVVSARDPEQRFPSLAIASGRAVLGWIERTATRDELRVSWLDLAARKVLVDAVKVAEAGRGELDSLTVASLDGARAELVYVRHDPSPLVLSPRVRARSITFAALGGQACTAAADCELGPCVDGVCCDRACDGVCEACNEPSALGVCKTVAGAPRGARTCAGGTGCAEATCDGFEPTTCAKFSKSFETVCAASSCDGALFTAAGYCDGRGTCATAKAASCAPFKCDPNGCLTTCSSDASCATGFVCQNGSCVTPEAKAACVDDGLASLGFDGTKKACAPYRCGAEGTCRTTCSSSLDCGPGATCDVASGVCTAGVPGEGDDGGCTLAPRPAKIHDRSGILAALLLALVARRRRAPASSVTMAAGRGTT